MSKHLRHRQRRDGGAADANELQRRPGPQSIDHRNGRRTTDSLPAAHSEANWTLDTATYPFRDGLNTVAVCASDFATLGDPNTTCSAPSSVEVDDSCSESTVAGGEVLSAQFESSNAEQATVGFGRSATVSGRPGQQRRRSGPRREPLRQDGRRSGSTSRRRAVGSVSTDANGRYRYEVAAGPNREIVVGYRHDSVQVARDVRYYAHAKPSLKLAAPRSCERRAGPLLGTRCRARCRVGGSSSCRQTRRARSAGSPSARRRRTAGRLRAQLPLHLDDASDPLSLPRDRAEAGRLPVARRQQ